MKFPKEARIGLLVTVAVVVFFAGLMFLRGSSIFSHEYKYFAYYDNVQGLQASAPVQVQGLQVGKVEAIELQQLGAGKNQIKVTLSINKKTHVPVNSVAQLISTDLLGTKGIALQMGNSNDIADDETKLQSGTEVGMIDKISAQVDPLIKEVRNVVASVDTVMLGVNGILNPEAQQQLHSSIAALNSTMNNFNQLSAKINGQSDALANVIANTNKITSNLASKNDKIDGIIDNANAASKKLADAPIDQTVRDLQAMANQLNAITTKINNGEGSLGMAVNDKKMYTELSGTLENLKSLLADINKHPSRYINLTIFGRKAKTDAP